MARCKLSDLPSSQTLLSPSILAADFANLARDVKEAESAGVELLHIDVMDGHFVPNISIGVPVVKSLRSQSDLIFDAHLMISHPLDYVEAFAKAGADHITIHVESESAVQDTIDAIKAQGMTAGLSIKPGTSVEEIEPYLAELDMVLVMTVEPGFGGQSFMPDMLEKVKDLKKMASVVNPSLHIEVDGGVSGENAAEVLAAGANVLVAGSAFFGHGSGLKIAASELRCES